MTTTSNTSALPAARPIYRAKTLDSLVTAGLSDKPADTFIRNDPSRRPSRGRRSQAGESPGEKGMPATQKMSAPVMRAYPTAADWRKAADDSVPQQVFSLVLAGSLSAAKSLMRAYGMSPDTKLGPFGLDEALERASASPTDIAKFRRFLDESRAAHPASQPQPQPQTQSQVPARSSGGAGEKTVGARPVPMPIALSQVRRAHSAPAADEGSSDDEPWPRRTGEVVPESGREPSRSPVRAPVSAGIAEPLPPLRAPERLRAKRALPLIEEEPATPRSGTGAARSSSARRRESTVGSNLPEGALSDHLGPDDVLHAEEETRRSRLYAFRRHCLDPLATAMLTGYTATKRTIHRALYACCISYVPGRPSQIPKRHYVSGPGLRRGVRR